MPIKKSTTSKSAVPKAAKPAAPKAATVAQKDHNHAALEASIAALKEEVAALKGQCHSCCAKLDELSKPSSSIDDPRVDKILELAKSSTSFGWFKAMLGKISN